MTKCEGCGEVLEPSRGPTPRRWCSEACRKRVSRARVVEGALEDRTRSTERAVRALVDDLELEPGSYPATLAELAIAQARMTDGNNTHASVALRNTLQTLDEVLGLVQQSEEDFSLVEIKMSMTREGI